MAAQVHSAEHSLRQWIGLSGFDLRPTSQGELGLAAFVVRLGAWSFRQGPFNVDK